MIRDVPRTSYKTAGCVMRALCPSASVPRIACAATRAWALQRDPVAAAARQTHSRRVQLIDLSRFMCDKRRCYAVVGGALVHKSDINHLKRARVRHDISQPYLLRKLNRL